jgi:hypothetical protein
MVLTPGARAVAFAITASSAIACAGGEGRELGGVEGTPERGGVEVVVDGGAGLDAAIPPPTMTSVADGEACVGLREVAQQRPLDLYVMYDQSGSMNDRTASGLTKWDAVKSAFTAFLSEPASAGIGIGLQYFALVRPGVPSTCSVEADCKGFGPCSAPKACDKESLAAGRTVACTSTADCKSGGRCVEFGVCQLRQTHGCFSSTGCGAFGPCVAIPRTCARRESCDVADYAKAEIPIAPLPGARDALVRSLAAHAPETATPTGPALEGAIEHATKWASAHPDHTVGVVLVTDGIPTTCSPVDIPSIASIAERGLQAGVRTYVIGVLGEGDGPAGANLDRIARAGGSSAAYLVSTAADVTGDFAAALQRIRGTALACQYDLPASASADWFAVNVKITDPMGKTSVVPYVDGGDCSGGGGWSYDVDPARGTPTRISLCASTCAALRASMANQVEVEIGCRTVSVVR